MRSRKTTTVPSTGRDSSTTDYGGCQELTSYGYRLFEITLRQKEGRTPIPFGVDGDSPWRFGNHIASLLDSHQGMAEVGLPHGAAVDAVDVEADPEPADGVTVPGATRPVFRIESHRQLGTHVGFEVKDGQNRGFDVAMAISGDVDDTPLEGLAPARTYRGMFVLPELGETGILALEVIDRRCPVTPLQRWLKRWSQSAAEPTGGMWWKLIIDQFTDEERLDELLRDGNVESLVLRSTKTGADRKRNRERYRFVAPVIDDALLEGIRDAVRSWRRRRRGPDAVTDQQAVRQLRGLVGVNIDNVVFDDGYVNITGAEGHKKISPSRMSEVFTYRLATDASPSDEAFYAAISDQLAKVGVPRTHELSLTPWP